jgi:claudin
LKSVGGGALPGGAVA